MGIVIIWRNHLPLIEKIPSSKMSIKVFNSDKSLAKNHIVEGNLRLFNF